MMYYDATGKDEIARHSGTDMRNLGFAPLGVATAATATPTTEYDIGENIPELEKKTGGVKYSPTGTKFGEGAAKAKVSKGGTVNVIVPPWQNYVLNPPAKPVPPLREPFWKKTVSTSKAASSLSNPFMAGLAGPFDAPFKAAQSAAQASAQKVKQQQEQQAKFGSAGAAAFKYGYDSDKYVVEDPTFQAQMVTYLKVVPKLELAAKQFVEAFSQNRITFDQYKQLALDSDVKLPADPSTPVAIWSSGGAFPEKWYWTDLKASAFLDKVVKATTAAPKPMAFPKVAPKSMALPKAAPLKAPSLIAAPKAAPTAMFKPFPGAAADDTAAQIAKLVTEAMGYFTALKTKGAMTDADNDSLIKQFGGPVWTVETATKYRDALKAKYDASLVAPAAAPAPAPAPVYGGGGGGGGGGGFEPGFGAPTPEVTPVTPPVTVAPPEPAKSALPLLALLGAGAWALLKK